MTERMEKIYEELYNKVLSKTYLAKKYDVSTKTIENTIIAYSKEMPDDIIYDTKIAAYRFKYLLPTYIPYQIFFTLFESSVANKTIKQDFLIIGKSLNTKGNMNMPMIKTSSLSPLAQKLITCTIGINQNCILKIDYKGHKKEKEIKFVIPQKITSTSFSYYLYCSYDKKNKKDVGQSRSLALTGIHSISPVEYIKGQKFAISGIGNAYGIINKDKFIMLKLQTTPANFFKREGLFQEYNYDFVTEEADGSIMMKMYYNSPNEIVSLLQKWMPLISIQDETTITKEIYDKISENYNQLIQGDKNE